MPRALDSNSSEVRGQRSGHHLEQRMRRRERLVREEIRERVERTADPRNDVEPPPRID